MLKETGGLKVIIAVKPKCVCIHGGMVSHKVLSLPAPPKANVRQAWLP